MSQPLAEIHRYHETSKHSFSRFAPGPGGLDWATQPDPFRRYAGAPLVELPRWSASEEWSDVEWDTATSGRVRPPAPVDARSISRLFFDSLALSAWKSFGGTSWSLRVNPSSGNLHPTEGYLIAPAVEGLGQRPAVYHYAPKEHCLERRVEFSGYDQLTQGLEGSVVPLFLALTSIHWRESWKYGERAFRYCHHDAGHAIAAVSIAAAGLGWRVQMVDGPATDDLRRLLGLPTESSCREFEADPDAERGPAEPEHPDALLAVFCGGDESSAEDPGLPEELLAELDGATWTGTPNRLSEGHVRWQLLEETAHLCAKPRTSPESPPRLPAPPTGLPSVSVSLRSVVRRRRSAVDMDGKTSIPRNHFYRAMMKTMPTVSPVPFGTFWWDPVVHLALFVHRVDDLTPGLYMLVRNPAALSELRESARSDFLWKPPEGCPDGLPLYQLHEADLRNTAAAVSCQQAIAANGCFSLGMITAFEQSLQKYGPWFYPRLYWECGAIGQVLYLEAEAMGVRSTGIGCFFDDPVHEVLGLKDKRFQSLYHFTVGAAVDDPRLTTLPAYPWQGEPLE